jgi:anti-sigma factor RsiW
MPRHAALQVMLARRDRLDPTEEADVAAHIATCPECRQRSIEYASQTAFLHTYERAAPPESLRSTVLARLDRQASADVSHVAQPARRFPMRALRGRSLWRLFRAHRLALRVSVAVATVAAIAIAVLGPLVSPHSAVPANAQAVRLLRSAVYADAAIPSSGSATTTYLAPATSLVSDHVVPYRFVARWSSMDAQHYRLEAQTVEPVIDSGTVVTVENGTHLVVYDTPANLALVQKNVTPDNSRYRTMPLSLPQPDMATDPRQSIQAYLDATQRDIPSSVPHFARIVGREQLLGRAAVEVQFAPVVRGIQCVPTSIKNGIWQGTKNCDTPRDYGTASVWIDDATHMILKYRLEFPPAYSNVPSILYRVTSLSVGNQAARPDLSVQLPSTVRVVTRPPANSMGRGSPAGGTQLPVPSGFLQPAVPDALSNVSTQMQTVAIPPHLSGRLDILYTQQASPTRTMPYTSGDRFLAIVERIRPNGLPAAALTGTHRQSARRRAQPSPTVASPVAPNSFGSPVCCRVVCAGAWLLTAAASLRGIGAALAVLGAFGVTATTASAKAKDEANRLVERLRAAYQLEAAEEGGLRLPASYRADQNKKGLRAKILRRIHALTIEPYGSKYAAAWSVWPGQRGAA